MKRGYYLCNWWGTQTIKFDPDIEFHCDEYAKRQSAFRTFKEAKKSALKELRESIELAQEQLVDLKRMTKEDARRET